MPVIFAPKWITPTGVIATCSETDVVAVPVAAGVFATVSVAVGQASITLTQDQVENLSDVRLGGAAVPFSIQGNDIVFAPVANATIFTLVASTPLSFQIIAGSLPPGLNLLAGGVIAGTVGNSPTVDYPTVIRCSDGLRVRDRQFTLSVTAVDKPPEWDFTALPEAVTVTGGNVSYTHYPLGEVSRGGSFSYVFGAYDEDGTVPHPRLIIPSSVESIGYKPGLPLGLSYNSATRRIDGVVSLAAEAGDYAFALSFQEAGAPAPLACSLRVLSTISDVVVPHASIQWTTPAGHLGTIRESDPCPFGVEASATTGGAIVYAVVGGSLPEGLSLNASTGLITGHAAFIDKDTRFTFSVRARLQDVFEDRTFSLFIRSVFDSGSILNIGLVPMGADRGEMLASGNLPYDDLFRPEDASFGIPPSPYIYVVGGLRGADLREATMGDGSPGLPRLDYHGRFELILGGFRVAYVRNDIGAILYEVLVREVIDPVIKAGGFSFDSLIPVELRVPYPQQPTKTIYENSIRNARMDLIRDLGFADAGSTRLPGPYGAEAMPVWMRSPQKAGNDTSALGYSLGFPVAYLKPTRGAAALLAAEADPYRVPNGRRMVFDGYVVEQTNLFSTTIDGTSAFLPIPVEVGMSSITVGRWVNRVQDIVVQYASGDIAVWTAGTQYSFDGQEIDFPPLVDDATLFVRVAEPTTSPTPLITNAPASGTSLFTGILTGSIRAIILNGVSVSGFSANGSYVNFQSSLSGGEILIRATGTSFDGRAGLDGEMEITAKYLKLPDVLGSI